MSTEERAELLDHYIVCLKPMFLLLYVNYTSTKQTDKTKEIYCKSKTLYDVGLQKHISTKPMFSSTPGYRRKYCRDPVSTIEVMS